MVIVGKFFACVSILKHFDLFLRKGTELAFIFFDTEIKFIVHRQTSESKVKVLCYDPRFRGASWLKLSEFPVIFFTRHILIIASVNFIALFV